MKKTSYLLKYKPDPIIVGEPSNKVFSNLNIGFNKPVNYFGRSKKVAR